MDELYRSFHSSMDTSNNNNNYFRVVGDGSNIMICSDHDHHQNYNDQDQVGSLMEMSDLIKAQIANHPFYPNLLSAYIDCRKVGAPPEMASLFEEISKENHSISITNTTTEIGSDPELDEFMKSYCEVLNKYKDELSKPFDEATNFLSSIESQFTNLCNETLTSHDTLYFADDISDREMSCCGELEAGEEGSGNRQGDDKLKEMLMRKYSGYLSSLRKEFLKKRKKGKLPKNARTALLDWWNTHYRWPYPTEEEKNRLSEMTGLDQKQINNWFINQRKRHWRPSEDMRFALMEGVSGGPIYFDSTGGAAGGIDT